MSLTCDQSSNLLYDGGAGRDGIPALLNPLLVSVGECGTAYLAKYEQLKRQFALLPDLRVVGVRGMDQASPSSAT